MPTYRVTVTQPAPIVEQTFELEADDEEHAREQAPLLAAIDTDPRWVVESVEEVAQ